MSPYQIYRHTSLGSSLQESLDALIFAGRIPPELAEKIMLQFDASMGVAFQDRVKLSLTFNAKLSSYRYFDHVWTLILRNVKFVRCGTTYFTVDRMKIVACAAERAMKEDENFSYRKRKFPEYEDLDSLPDDTIVRVGCSTVSRY